MKTICLQRPSTPQRDRLEPHVVDPNWAACLADENARRDGVHATNDHQGDAACAEGPMHLAEIQHLPQNQPRRVRWRGAVGTPALPPPRETPATASTTDSVLTSRPSRTSTRLAPCNSPANSLSGPCEPATGCHDPKAQWYRLVSPKRPNHWRLGPNQAHRMVSQSVPSGTVLHPNARHMSSHRLRYHRSVPTVQQPHQCVVANQPPSTPGSGRLWPVQLWPIHFWPAHLASQFWPIHFWPKLNVSG